MDSWRRQLDSLHGKKVEVEENMASKSTESLKILASSSLEVHSQLKLRSDQISGLSNNIAYLEHAILLEQVGL